MSLIREQSREVFAALPQTLHSGVAQAAGAAIVACVLAAAFGWLTRSDPGKHFGEGKVVTLASVAVLALCAMCSAANAVRLRGGARRAGWVILGVLLAIAALDDLWKLHERLEVWFGYDQVAHGLDDLLLIVYPICAAVVFGVLLRADIGAQPVAICRLALAGVLFCGMVTLDSLHGPAWIEDSLKLTAGAVILATVRAAGVATALRDEANIIAPRRARQPG